MAEDAAIVEAGLDLGLSDSAALGVSYDGRIGSGVQRHGFNARFVFSF